VYTHFLCLAPTRAGKPFLAINKRFYIIPRLIYRNEAVRILARIGVYVCHCGLNIAGVVDVEGVADYARKLPDVKVARDKTYLCSDAGQKMIKEDIEQNKLDRIVVASCSPRMHEETFRRAVSEAGLNPYLLDMINIREQDSWCHSKEPEKATEKAKALIQMAVTRATRLEPLKRGKVKAHRRVLVVKPTGESWLWAGELLEYKLLWIWLTLGSESTSWRSPQVLVAEWLS